MTYTGNKLQQSLIALIVGLMTLNIQAAVPYRQTEAHNRAGAHSQAEIHSKARAHDQAEPHSKTEAYGQGGNISPFGSQKMENPYTIQKPRVDRIIPGWNDPESLEKLRELAAWRSDPGYYPMRFGDPRHRQVCKPESIPRSTPTEQFIDHQDGTVTDQATGLMWMRCALGHTWDGTSCPGVILRTEWQGALQATQKLNQAGGFAGHTDWRLPNIKELTSIVEWACFSPAANLEIFPKTENIYYWSSTPGIWTMGEPPRTQYWGTNFTQGKAETHDSYIRRVRLVRIPD